MINHHRTYLVVLSKPPYDLRGKYPLFHIKMRGGFIQKIKVCCPAEAGRYRNPLEFTAAQFVDLLAKEPFKLQRFDDFRLVITCPELFIYGTQKIRNHNRFICLDVLGLIGYLQVHLYFPCRGLYLSSQYLYKRGFSDPVRAHYTRYLSFPYLPASGSELEPLIVFFRKRFKS